MQYARSHTDLDIGGFQVDNRAGHRTQMALNEVDPIEWTPEARSHYRIDVGATGDGRYVQGWHGRERADRSFRWSRGSSRLVLPARSGERHQLTLEWRVPKPAQGPETGLYLDGERIAPLGDASPFTLTLPPAAGDRLRLELRCQAWIPSQTILGSGDARTLGIQLFSITMKTPGTKAPKFNANTGRNCSGQPRINANARE